MFHLACHWHCHTTYKMLRKYSDFVSWKSFRIDAKIFSANLFVSAWLWVRGSRSVPWEPCWGMLVWHSDLRLCFHSHDQQQIREWSILLEISKLIKSATNKLLNHFPNLCSKVSRVCTVYYKQRHKNLN